MNYLKYLKSIIWIFSSLLIFIIIMTLLYNFNIISTKTLNVLEIISTLISNFIGGMYIGKNSKSKGFLEGIKISGIFVSILIILALSLHIKINLGLLIYYLLIIFITIIGSIIGINQKGNQS